MSSGHNIYFWDFTKCYILQYSSKSRLRDHHTLVVGFSDYDVTSPCQISTLIKALYTNTSVRQRFSWRSFQRKSISQNRSMRATKVALTLLRKWEVGPTLFMKAMYLGFRPCTKISQEYIQSFHTRNWNQNLKIHYLNYKYCSLIILIWFKSHKSWLLWKTICSYKCVSVKYCSLLKLWYGVLGSLSEKSSFSSSYCKNRNTSSLAT